MQNLDDAPNAVSICFPAAPPICPYVFTFPQVGSFRREKMSAESTAESRVSSDRQTQTRKIFYKLDLSLIFIRIARATRATFARINSLNELKLRLAVIRTDQRD